VIEFILFASPDRWHRWAATARADGCVIDVDRGRGWIQAVGVAVHTPRTSPVGIARLDVGHIEDLRIVLPEGHVSGFVASTFVEGFDVEPLALGNVLARLGIGSIRVLVVEIKIHGAVGSISNIESEERIADLAAFGFPLEHVPPRWIAVGNIAPWKVVPDTVIEVGVTFGLEPTKQAGSAGGDTGRIPSTNIEFCGMDTTVSDGNGIHTRDGSSTVKNTASNVGPARDVGPTPLG
jgi:hypothetical protein